MVWKTEPNRGHAERLGCSESDIEVEEDDIDNNIENNEH